MPNTFELIASSTVGAGGAASIDFTSIPSTYTDLVLKLSVRNTGTGNVVDGYLRFNGSSSSYGTTRAIQGDGAGASSINNTTSTYMSWQVEMSGTTATANTFGNIDLYIPNYAGNTNKSVSGDQVTENNGTTAYAFLTAGIWNNTSAINQITLYPVSNNFAQYSTAYLYGVKNA